MKYLFVRPTARSIIRSAVYIHDGNIATRMYVTINSIPSSTTFLLPRFFPVEIATNDLHDFS
jgi:hypothetical protein